jgi:hypothetical protein
MSDPRRYLFVDESDFYDLRGLEKVMHQPEKHSSNPLLVREHPWEAVTAQLYGTVLYDEEEELFKMWYMAGPDRSRNPRIIIDGRRITGLVQAYATSVDGIRWEKPELDLVSFGGSTKNNILPVGEFGVEGMCVIKEPDDPDPRRRYKAVWWDHDGESMKFDATGMVIEGSVGGLYVGWSADGIHWEHHPGNPVIDCFSDTGQQLVWDPVRERYVAFGRLGSAGRVVERSESADLTSWTEPELVFTTDDMDPFCSQIYGMGISVCEGFYLGMPWVLAQPVADTRGDGNDGRIHVQLTSSRDGVRWERTGGREPFIPNGAAGEWDAGIIYTATKPVVLKDRILVYYYGNAWPHIPGGDDSNPRGIGLATLRRDGYVSLDAGDEEGDFGTVPFVAGEEVEIHLNVDAKDGRVYARLSDEVRCEALPDIEPSEAIEGDHLDVTLRWSREQMKAFSGKKVCARIYGRRASFYSYWFTSTSLRL